MESSRQRLYRTEGVIIRRTDIGEADKILTIFAPRHGKVRAIAKGVRRPESHLGGNVELFVRSSLLIARGRQLDIVTQAETIAAFKSLRQQLSTIQAAFYLGELLDGLTEEGLANDEIYTLLVESLTALERGAAIAPVSRYYEYRLLALLGYRLEVMQCVQCRRPLEPVINRFSAEMGGVLCPDCHPIGLLLRPISVTALKVLRLMARDSLAVLLRYRLSETVLEELASLGRACVRLHLEHEPRSWSLAAGEPPA